MLLLLLIALMTSNILTQTMTVKADNVATQWGFLTTGYDPDEKTWQTQLCDAVTDFYPGSYYAQDAYWTLSTDTNLYNTLQWCQENSTWSTTFWVGDFYPYYVTNQYGSTLHHFFYGYNGNDVSDYEAKPNANYLQASKQYFCFIWTCVCGGCYWDPGYVPGDSLYGYTDFDNYTLTVGMPYAFTGTNGMSLDGYGDSDAGNYCYIGWENTSWEVQTVANSTDPENDALGWFIYFFYSHMLEQNRPSVYQSLNFASDVMWGCSYGSSTLDYGYEDTTSPGGPYWCRLRVYGNSDICFP
jgi:hypothetical protein